MLRRLPPIVIWIIAVGMTILAGFLVLGALIVAIGSVAGVILRSHENLFPQVQVWSDGNSLVWLGYGHYLARPIAFSVSLILLTVLQKWIFRRFYDVTLHGWIAVSMRGILPFTCVILILEFHKLNNALQNQYALPNMLLVLQLIFCVSIISSSILQWDMLKRYIPKAGVWLLVNLLLLGMDALYFWMLHTVFVSEALFFVIVAVHGVIASLVLQSMVLRRKQKLVTQ